MKNYFTEEEAWKELHFVDGDKHWSPPRIKHKDEGKTYSAECLWGATAAIELVRHVRGFKDRDRLEFVCRQIVEAGEWDGYVIGFFSTLSEIVALDKPMIGTTEMIFAEDEIATAPKCDCEGEAQP